MRKTSVLIIAGLVLAFLCGYLLGRPHGELHTRTEVRIDTVHDTVTIASPVQRDSVVLRYVTAKLPVATSDTLSAENYAQKELENICDSSTVILPITQNHYADSTYEAWVSGYHPELDSIKLFNKTEFVTTTIKQRQKRFGIGIHAGYGVTTKGTIPYIGVGISYNLWNF